MLDIGLTVFDVLNRVGYWTVFDVLNCLGY